jgi:DNA-directed RNA polymerase specialized sigma24 family protein
MPASVTRWILALKEGDQEAAQRLWERYFLRLAQMAKHRMERLPSPIVDEEDVALSVLDSLCRGAQAGRFPDLRDRSDLWSLLVAITKQKVADKKRWQYRQKRGGGKALNEADLAPDAAGRQLTLDDLVNDAPTPDLMVALEEECARMFGMLKDDTMREIAAAKLEGYSSREIAERLDVSPRTVQRKLEIIQKTWSAQLQEEL